MATVSTIMKHVHMGTIDTVFSLLDGKHEFLEAKNFQILRSFK